MKRKLKNGLALVFATMAIVPASACSCKINDYGVCNRIYQNINVVITYNGSTIVHKGDMYSISRKGVLDPDKLFYLACGQEVILHDNNYIIYSENSNPDFPKCEKCFGK